MSYLEEGTPWFVDITDKLELAIEPEDDGQPITDSEDEKVRKRLKRATKRKSRRNNLCVLVRQALVAGSVTLLLSVSALLSCFPVPALLSCPESPTLSLSCLPIPTLSSCLELPTQLSFCPLMPAPLSCLTMPILSSHLMPALSFLSVLASAFCSTLGPALIWLISSALKIFK